MKLTANQYAKSRGLAVATVTAAIKEGRLPTSVKQLPNRRYEIDAELADQEWAENTDSGTGGAAHVSKRKPEIVATVLPADTGETMTYAEARAQHERFKARLAELELETRESKLVNAEEVKQAAFKTARQVRDALLNLPDRVAGELAAETNAFKVHQRLTKEIRRALEELKLE